MGWKTGPPRTIGPTGCSRYSNDVTIPKLPPPPRIAQKRSGFSSSLAVTISPCAVTTSAERRLSTVAPCFRISHPIPPPSVRPAIPVCVTIPPTVASPKSCVSRSSSPQRTPAQRARCASPDRLGFPSSAKGRSRGRHRIPRDPRRRGRPSARPPGGRARGRSGPRRRHRRRRCIARCRQGGGRSLRSRSRGPRRSPHRRGRTPGLRRSCGDARRRWPSSLLSSR